MKLARWIGAVDFWKAGRLSIGRMVYAKLCLRKMNLVAVSGPDWRGERW